MKFGYALDDRGLTFLQNVLLIPENEQDVKLLLLLQNATLIGKDWNFCPVGENLRNKPPFKGGPLKLTIDGID